MAIRSVMIVDDSEVDRYILKRLMKDAKAASQFFEVDNGKEAIELFQKYKGDAADLPEGFPPALILLDINMPLMNGFEFLECFQRLSAEEPSLDSAVVMMFSSSNNREDREKALSYPCVKDYIVKMPESPDELKAILCKTFPQCCA